MFSFGPQNPSTPGAAPAALPTQLPTTSAAPIDPATAAAYALQGLGSAPIEERLPFLPPDMQFDATVDKVRIGGLDAASKVGFSFYYDFTVNQCSSPSIPAGSKFSHRTSGFMSRDAKAFAFSELKQFMCESLKKFGLTLAWNGEGMTIPNGVDPWVYAAVQMAQQDMAVGARLFIQTSRAQGKSGNSKTKASFHAAA